ncbi:hypothetical protein BXZ70DRAFT_954159 [Cristinia sonorae]|uniref:DUF7918 domain-containing protein n=1 Tax=Cristinia sonorae TaxID=1940300 RepID=A0A8K0UGP7_9AGAR|nr:hypothetical protein BXZ70DRAFT_954159 [Cristinia sonorae]
MPAIRGVNVSIVIEGQEAPEYETLVTGDRSVSCYIVSAVGQTFTIKILNSSEQDISVCPALDGNWARESYCEVGKEKVIHGPNVTKTSFRPYQFGELRLTDDGQAEADAHRWEDLGCITIRVRRAKPGTYKLTEKSKAYRQPVPGNDDPIHEHCKKVGMHRVTLGAEKPRKSSCSASWRKIEPTDAPYATIKFMYRPKDVLQAQEIIPPSPTIPSASTSRKRCDDRPHAYRPPRSGSNELLSQHTADVKREPSEASNGALIRSRELAVKRARVEAAKAALELAEAELDIARSGSVALLKREPSPGPSLRHPRVSASRKSAIVIDLTDN